MICPMEQKTSVYYVQHQPATLNSFSDLNRRFFCCLQQILWLSIVTVFSSSVHRPRSIVKTPTFENIRLVQTIDGSRGKTTHPSVSACASVLGSLRRKLDRSRRDDGKKKERSFFPSTLPSSIRLCVRLRFHGSYLTVRILPSLVWTKLSKTVNETNLIKSDVPN